jgi:adenine deaminase
MTSKYVRCAVYLILGVVFPSLALTAQSPSNPAPHRVIVRAGHVLDVKTGNTLTDQAIVIEDDKIVSVSSAASIKADPAAETIHLPNATVLPGLIDSHTQRAKPAVS